MIIPLGPEDREVRRIPWITAAILVANLLVHLLVSFSPWAAQAERHADETGRRFLSYWAQHPWLAMPDEYARYVGKQRAAREAKQIEKAQLILEVRGFRQNEEMLPRERDELSALAAEWVKAQQATPAQALGFVPAKKTAASLLSSMFTHGSWWHLLGNMLFLLMTAPLLEDRYGRLLFPLFYLTAGSVAAFSFAARSPDALTPLIGASGAIAGVMGAFTIRLFRTRMVYLVMPIPIFFFFRFRVRVPAWVVFPFWFLEQLAANAIAPDAGVAWSAHIGGFVFGAGFAVAMKLFSVEEKWIHPAIEKEIGWEQDPALVRAGERRAAGDPAGAREQLRIGLKADPTNVDGWRALFDVACDLRDEEEAARAATRRMELLSAKDPEEAQIAAAEAIEHVPNALSGRFWMLLAGLRERTGDARGAYECYEAAVVRFPQDPLTARALVKMAEITARAGEPEVAWRLVRLAQSHPACLEGWHTAAERIVVSLPPGSAPAHVEEPVSVRGRFTPRGIRTLPMAAVFAVAPPAPRPAPAVATSLPPSPVPPRPPAPPPSLPAPRDAAPVPPAPSAPPSRRAVRPVVLWSAGGVAAVAVVAAAVLVWEPWASPSPPARAEASAPVVPAAPLPAAAPLVRIEPSAPAPGSTVPPAADAGPEVPLRVTFQSPFAAGQVIVKVKDRTVLSKDFDFGKESGGGLLDEIAVVPSGSVELKVWVTSRDHAVRAYATLSSTIPAAEPGVLELSFSGAALALAVK